MSYAQDHYMDREMVRLQQKTVDQAAEIERLIAERDAALLVQRNASVALDQLRAALLKAEEADQQHNNCDECEPCDAPETCVKCFPLADDARLMRWAALGINQPKPART